MFKNIKDSQADTSGQQPGSEYNREEKAKSKRYIIFWYLSFLFLFLGFIVGFYVGINNTEESKIVRDANEQLKNDQIIKKNGDITSQDSQIDFQLYWDVWDTVKEYHLYDGKIKDKQLFYGSVKGIVKSLEDPYSSFFDPEEAKQFEEDLSGSFEGIGTQIGIKDDRLTIIAPLPDSPAENAGIEPGDKVFFIDDYDTTGISIDEAVTRIRGEKGSQVVLTILRQGEDDLLEISITRDVIVLEAVTWENFKIDDKNLFYIEIITFNEETESNLQEAVKQALKIQPDGLIIDLRNNPGGFLDLAIVTASLWVEDGIIVTEEYGNDRVNKHWAVGPAVLTSFPTIVLVNQGSASASEIVAGALQDHNEAYIIGAQTFGKGSVQSLFEFDDDSAAKITVAEWVTPNGRHIDEVGITPNLEIPLSFEDFKAEKDPQLDKAKELLLLPESEIKAEIAKAKEFVKEEE